ncbi:hypothetical protein K525DRAFT_275267 [Schizophyllum commune Loenen D]|nr:hypothetical protein K525DRAFT_275267 [Schizophyllum commune Loenen D]
MPFALDHHHDRLPFHPTAASDAIVPPTSSLDVYVAAAAAAVLLDMAAFSHIHDPPQRSTAHVSVMPHPTPPSLTGLHCRHRPLRATQMLCATRALRLAPHLSPAPRVSQDAQHRRLAMSAWRARQRRLSATRIRARGVIVAIATMTWRWPESPFAVHHPLLPSVCHPQDGARRGCR